MPGARQEEPASQRVRAAGAVPGVSAQLHALTMGVSGAILLHVFGAVLCLTESRALQCYSFEHTYSSPFDLSAMKLPTVSCPSRCFEAVSSLSTGYRASVTLVKKGCWTGPRSGRMDADARSLPPDYSLVRGCATDLCNTDLGSHDSIPNLSPAPDPPTLSGVECYSCLGVHPEDCALNRSRRVQCHQDQSACFQGNGRMTVDNFSVPVYIRTCHRPSCTTVGTSSPWTNIDLQGSCCKGSLCNKDSVTQSFATAAATASPQAPHFLAVLLMASLLVSALGGPLRLSP